MTRTGVAARLGLALLAVALLCGCESAPRTGMIEGSAFHAAATTLIEDQNESVAPPLTHVIAVIPLADERVLLLDQFEPYLRVYDQGRFERALVRTGSGPDELTKPWRAVAADSNLWVVANDALSRWSRDDLTEREKLGPVQGILALAPECDGDLAAVYEGHPEQTHTQAMSSRLGDFGVKVHTDSGWASYPVMPAERFLPVGYDFRALVENDRVVVFNPVRRQIEVLGCQGERLDSIPVPALAEWSRIPTVRGLAHVQEQIVFFLDGPDVAGQPATHVLLWRPETGTVTHRTIEGEFALHSASRGSVWLVEYDPLPTVLSVPVAEFTSLLGVS